MPYKMSWWNWAWSARNSLKNFANGVIQMENENSFSGSLISEQMGRDKLNNNV